MATNSSANCSSTTNKPDGKEGYQNFFEVDYDTCLIILSALIVGINILVVSLFISRRHLRTKTNTLLVSLAASDLMMGLFGIPTSIACNAFALDPSLSPVLCYSAVVIFRFISISTILHIFAITIERYVSVVYPFKYLATVNRRRILVMISAVWFISLFIALIQLSWQGDLTSFAVAADPRQRLQFGVIYNLLWFVLCFALPSCVMVFVYYRIFKVIRHQAKEIRKLHKVGEVINAGNSTPNAARPIMQAEARAIVIFALMLGIFVTCWLTWYIGGLQEYQIVDSIALDEVWFSVFDFFRFLTSFINPFLYTFLKPDFRQALVSVLPCSKASSCSKQQKYTRAEITVTKV